MNECEGEEEEEEEEEESTSWSSDEGLGTHSK
jgi:hypothetical protein